MTFSVSTAWALLALSKSSSVVCAAGVRLGFVAGFAAARGAFFVTAGLGVICNPSVGESMD